MRLPTTATATATAASGDGNVFSSVQSAHPQLFKLAKQVYQVLIRLCVLLARVPSGQDCDESSECATARQHK